MEYIYLKDICDLDNGYAFKSDSYVEESNTLNCRMSNIRPDGTFDIFYNAKYLPDDFAIKYKNYLLKDGDLIIAMTDMAGDPKILGIPTVVDTKGKNLLLNQRVGKLRFIESNYQVNVVYLKIALQAQYIRTYFKQFAAGGVQLNVGKKEILNAKIAFRNIEEQEYIVNVIDNINKLINTKKREIELLDELVKSRFIELFGDVLANDKNFETCKFGDYVKQMNIGPFGSDLKNDCFVSKENGYCMVYEQKHAIDKDFTVASRYVNEDKYNHLKRFDVGPGDILVSCRGTIGKCCIIPDNSPHGIIHPSLMMVKPNDEVNNKFLLFLLEKILSEQLEQGSGVKMAIKATELAKINTIKPSRELQDEYVSFVEKVDKSKFICQQKINYYQELLDKKMDEYFNVEAN